MHVHDLETKAHIRVRLPAKPFALSLTSDRAAVAMAERKVSVYDLQALKQLINQASGTADNQGILEVLALAAARKQPKVHDARDRVHARRQRLRYLQHRGSCGRRVV